VRSTPATIQGNQVIEPLLRRLRARDFVSAHEEAILRRSVREVKGREAGATIIHAAEDLDCSTVLLEGILARYKVVGKKRQITQLHVSGDFADLHSFTLKRLDHNILALTPCRIGLVPHEALEEIMREEPHLAELLWFLTNLDAAIHREWITSLGLRSAGERVAHLFCELFCRFEIVGLADPQGYSLNLTQAEVGDCLRLHYVDMSRALKKMRESGLVEFKRRRVAVRDRKALEAFAKFDPTYLYLDRLRA
jgi:CRP-like cAMP-binding protein